MSRFGKIIDVLIQLPEMYVFFSLSVTIMGLHANHVQRQTHQGIVCTCACHGALCTRLKSWDNFSRMIEPQIRCFHTCVMSGFQDIRRSGATGNQCPCEYGSTTHKLRIYVPVRIFFASLRAFVTAHHQHHSRCRFCKNYFGSPRGRSPSLPGYGSRRNLLDSTPDTRKEETSIEKASCWKNVKIILLHILPGKFLTYIHSAAAFELWLHI